MSRYRTVRNIQRRHLFLHVKDTSQLSSNRDRAIPSQQAWIASADTILLLSAHPTRGVDPIAGAILALSEFLITDTCIQTTTPEEQHVQHFGKLCSQSSCWTGFSEFCSQPRLTTGLSNHRVESGRSNPFNWWYSSLLGLEIKRMVETDLLKPLHWGF